MNSDFEIYGNPMADITVLRLVGEHEHNIDKELELIKNQVDEKLPLLGSNAKFECCFMTIAVNDWTFEMTPWDFDDSALNNMLEGRRGGALEKLTSIFDDVIHKYESKYENDSRRYILSGYSLAGLFALWAAYQTDKFYAIVAGSPSVWYPEWIKYIDNNKCRAQIVYLSIGNREHRTRNVLMSQVANNIQQQYEVLNSQGVDTMLEINPGNHFTQVSERMIKGIAECIISLT